MGDECRRRPGNAGRQPIARHRVRQDTSRSRRRWSFPAAASPRTSKPAPRKSVRSVPALLAHAGAGMGQHAGRSSIRATRKTRTSPASHAARSSRSTIGRRCWRGSSGAQKTRRLGASTGSFWIWSAYSLSAVLVAHRQRMVEGARRSRQREDVHQRRRRPSLPRSRRGEAMGRTSRPGGDIHYVRGTVPPARCS